MANRYGENPYRRSGNSYSPRGHRGAPRRRRFRLNAANLAIMALVLVAGVVVTVSFLSNGKKNGGGGSTPAPTVAVGTSAAAQSPAGQDATTTPEASATAGQSPEASATQPEATQTDQPAGAGEYFTSGDVQVDMDAMTYKSADLYVKVTNVNEDGVNYYVADCRAKDSDRLFRAMANDKYAVHKEELSSVMAKRHGAVIAVNGDYFGSADTGSSDTTHRNGKGIVIVNGKLYRSNPWYDIAAIFKDGTMKTYAKSDITADGLMSAGAVQAFNFGPMLMDGNGKALSQTQIKARPPKYNPANPRCGIGYIEPNHFVFAVVDGRRGDYGVSRGMTTYEFAKLFESLGCKTAYNLDGGGSATMVFMGKVINHPCDNGREERSVSDIVYFGESETDQATIDRMGN